MVIYHHCYWGHFLENMLFCDRARSFEGIFSEVLSDLPNYPAFLAYVMLLRFLALTKVTGYTLCSSCFYGN